MGPTFFKCFLLVKVVIHRWTLEKGVEKFYDFVTSSIDGRLFDCVTAVVVLFAAYVPMAEDAVLAERRRCIMQVRLSR